MQKIYDAIEMVHPSKITPSPVLEAVYEIRFKRGIVSPNALFGLLISGFSSEYGSPIDLPAAQVPPAIRNADGSWHFKPTNAISNKEFLIQIGDDVLTLINKENTKDQDTRYVGWKRFSLEIEKINKWANEHGLTNHVLRLGLRYINFFPEIDGMKEFNVSASLAGEELSSCVIQTSFDEGDVKQNLQVSNAANVNGKQGSIIDIDSMIENPILEKSSVTKSTENLHNQAKGLFFKTLGETYLSKLKTS